MIKLPLHPTLFYRKTNGLITEVSRLIGNGVTFSMPENIAQSLSYGVELTFGQPVFQWWRVNANFTYFKNEIDAGVSLAEINNNSYSWMGKFNSNFNLFSGLQLAADDQLFSSYDYAPGKEECNVFCRHSS